MGTCVYIGYVLTEDMWKDYVHGYAHKHVEGVYSVCICEGIYVQKMKWLPCETEYWLVLCKVGEG